MGKVRSFAISIRFSCTRLSPNSECTRLAGQRKSLEGSVVKYCYKGFQDKLSLLKTDRDTGTMDNECKIHGLMPKETKKC